MWIQPLLAVHILAAGVGLLVFLAFQQWLETRKDRHSIGRVSRSDADRHFSYLAFHPMLTVMRLIARNDGYLAFGFPQSWIACAVVVAAAFGICNLGDGS